MSSLATCEKQREGGEHIPGQGKALHQLCYVFLTPTNTQLIWFVVSRYTVTLPTTRWFVRQQIRVISQWFKASIIRSSASSIVWSSGYLFSHQDASIRVCQCQMHQSSKVCLDEGDFLRGHFRMSLNFMSKKIYITMDITVSLCDRALFSWTERGRAIVGTLCPDNVLTKINLITCVIHTHTHTHTHILCELIQGLPLTCINSIT